MGFTDTSARIFGAVQGASHAAHFAATATYLVLLALMLRLPGARMSRVYRAKAAAAVIGRGERLEQ